MQYNIRVNRRIRNVKVYRIIKKMEKGPNPLTKLFIKIFSGKKKEEI
jgi:hypothetical protein